METERMKISHTLSLSETTSLKRDQNQNEESPNFVKDPSLRIGTRLTKSASWFNSLSRRASRKTPIKKRSFAAFSSGNESFTAPCPRLNKSDWDVRRSPVLVAPDLLLGAPIHSTSRSTDCLDLDSTSAGSFCDVATPTLEPASPLQTCLCHSESSPTRYRVRYREKMRKYHAVIRLNNSTSDMSTLDLSNLEEGEVPENPALYYTIDSRRLASKHKKSLKERKLLNGVKRFNLDPEEGLKYLQEFNFIDNKPESVAKFLFRQERLSKKQIGKYLGGHHQFNKDVLRHFVECHEFTQLLLVQALRQFLWSFRLPGEAMQIDRVMDAFAAHYCRQNPYLFEETDTCFILSFSIIMLNTALHNPNAKMKITAEQFIKQNKGINSGRDLAPDMLEAIFRNIKEEPFKIPDETYDDLMYTFFSPEREGWLLKQGGSWKNWKRRWFVLNDRCLYYFQHTAENVPKGIIPLENVRVRALDEKDGKRWVFEIYSEQADIIKGCKTDSSGTVVQGNHKSYRMSATSKDDMDQWIECIQDSIRDNPFHKIIADKKAAIRRRSGNKVIVPIIPAAAGDGMSQDEDD
ncbi:cytohesin-3 isoform X2 [Eurytemora carolleeae]|uniref:cytohesin-3 isoform X2 n=1 Tax=Eurytemora carolleeae TaxID=1294199 RepID=UPI000C784915|nr:cytohesin-3 isoform X2 [Eurytemora carolleeae]|eukprot:XP_023349535.1 cytohesin-3-like isoform X2 [Eurytemora affinis]